MEKTMKKQEIIATAENATIDNGMPMTATLADYCNKYTNVTLADIAKATGANVTVMRGKAREPIVGEVYDPEKVNYKAVEEYLRKRNPSLRLESLLWEEMNTPKEKTSRALVLDYTVGTHYNIRRLHGEFTVVYATETHVCLCPCDPSDTVLRVYHKDTFKAYSPVLLRGNDTTEEAEEAEGEENTDE